jgi:DNA-3-methyladenine glycosylase
MLPLRFCRRDAETVACELLGKLLVARIGRRTRRARIVETEAYVGAYDLACHASRGRTPRTAVMFGEGGHAYVYFIYGMYHMLNIVTGRDGDPQAVLLRAAEPLDGWEVDLSGPGKLARAFELTREHKNLSLSTPRLYLTRGTAPAGISCSPRIGVDYAGNWREAHLRFFDAASRAVSRRPREGKMDTNPRG